MRFLDSALSLAAFWTWLSYLWFVVSPRNGFALVSGLFSVLVFLGLAISFSVDLRRREESDKARLERNATTDPRDPMWALEVLEDDRVPSANARKIESPDKAYPHEVVVIASEEEIADLVRLLRRAVGADP